MPQSTYEIDARWFPQFIGGHVTGSTFGVPGIDAEYDYIVVGGGTAGGVVAARLIENTGFTVAVIEGGSFYELYNGNRSQIPQYSLEGASEDWLPAVDWGMVAEPDPGANNNQWLYSQGKCLGGSSGRNQMLYNRGTRGSYALWAEEVGDDSYTWDNMWPFYEKSVTHNAPDMSTRSANSSLDFSVEAFLNMNGPLQISYPKYAQPLGTYGSQIWNAAGLDPVPDLVSGELIGHTYFTFTQDPDLMTRSSSETAFLSPAMQSSDRLTVYLSSVAEKVLFDDNKRAIGVQIDQPADVPSYRLTARKEVIISAGAMRSPQLLMLSGIGPKAALRDLDIPIVSILEGVGQEMHDTCSIGGPGFAINVDAAYAFTFSEAAWKEAQELFIQGATGPLSNEGSDYVAFAKLPEAYRENFTAATNEAFAYFPDDWPELEISLTANAGGPEDGRSYGSLAIQITATNSRGNVSINSTNVLDQPVIHTNWLQDEADQQLAMASYRWLHDVARNAVPSELRVGPIFNPHPDILYDDAKLAKYLNEEGVNPIHHASSTCRMGKDGDKAAVVDSKGRVFGVSNLRVIDSSSFRHCPPGHTQAATYAHAEKLVMDVVNAAGGEYKVAHGVV